MVKAASGPHGAALVDGVGFRLSRLARQLRSTWSRELAELGLTPPLAAVLRGVDEEPGISVRALARTLGTDAMSVKRCADELEELGFIRSGSLEEDRRPRTLTLTPRGRALVKRINGRVALREQRIEAVLGASGRDALIELVSELETALDTPDVAYADSTTPSRRRAPEHAELKTKNAKKKEVG